MTNGPQKSEQLDSSKDSGKDAIRHPEKTDAKLRGESQSGASGHVTQYKENLNKEKEARNQSLDEQIQKNGKAKIGRISDHFQCSMEIRDGDNVIVKGRSKQEIVQAIKQMEQASDKGMMLGPGGRFLQSDSVIAAKSAEHPALVGLGRDPSVPNSESFLKTHQEMAMSPADKAIQGPQLIALQKKVDDDVAKFYEMQKSIKEQDKQFVKDLHSATHTDRNTKAAEIQAKFEHLPLEQRNKLLAEQDALQAKNREYLQLGKTDLPAEEAQLFKAKAQTNFSENLAKIDRTESPEVRKQIYASLNTMLESKNDTHPMSDERRKEFAYALAEQIANRGTVTTQGQKDTCQSADIQRLLLEKDPGFYAEQAANLVSSGALLFKGETGASKVSPKKEILLSSAQLNNDDGNPQRDPLSAAMQTAFADKLATIYDPSMGYQYIDAKAGSSPKVNTAPERMPPKYEDAKTGEYVISRSGDSFPFQGSIPAVEASLLHKLTGDNYVATPKVVNNTAELRQILQKAGQAEYPIILGITSADGAHTICVTNFNTATGKATIMDSARFPSEKLAEQNVDQFYKWLLDQKKANDQKEHHSPDPNKAHRVAVTAICKAP